MSPGDIRDSTDVESLQMIDYVWPWWNKQQSLPLSSCPPEEAAGFSERVIKHKQATCQGYFPTSKKVDGAAVCFSAYMLNNQRNSNCKPGLALCLKEYVTLIDRWMDRQTDRANAWKQNNNCLTKHEILND